MAIDPHDRNESWRRIRVGLTGMGGIVLLIGLANAMLQQIGSKQAEAVQTVTGGSPKASPEKTEPLAELGVAPGAPTQADDRPPKK